MQEFAHARLSRSVAGGAGHAMRGRDALAGWAGVRAGDAAAGYGRARTRGVGRATGAPGRRRAPLAEAGTTGDSGATAGTGS